jgi:hypothetical protein
MKQYLRMDYVGAKCMLLFGRKQGERILVYLNYNMTLSLI